MKCRRMKGLIMTDYIDGNLKGRALEEVESHLRSCPACKAVKDELIAAGRLFKADSLEELPSRVWENIRARINPEPSRIRFAEGVLDRVRHLLPRMKPAVAIASAAIVTLLVLTAMRLTGLKDYSRGVEPADDILTISYVNGDAYGSEDGFGTRLEEYFL